jgi:putative long chain acyl-CoA synthase
MPSGLWRRVNERFAPARVLEFYASAQGEAILVNLTGARTGAGGRPLPGSAEVRIAEWDLESGQLLTGRDGFARRCGAGQTGMLLTRVDPGSVTATESPLRGVFSAGDSWVSTGDLFRQDEDGDLWLVDPVAALVRTADGRVPTSPTREALEELDAVDLAVAYGVRPRKGAAEQLVAAVSARAGMELDAAKVSAALAALPEAERPTAVRVVDRIPTTTWYRPRLGELRAKGLRADGDRLLRADRARGRYAERG